MSGERLATYAQVYGDDHDNDASDTAHTRDAVKRSPTNSGRNGDDDRDDDVDLLGPSRTVEPPSEWIAIRDVCATEVATRQARWAWSGRAPAATTIILEGDPDCMKSTLACSMVAAFSTGTRLPDWRDEALAAFTGPVNVGYVTAEDDPSATLLPRYLVAGGDPTRMFFYQAVDVHGLDDEGTVADLLALPRHIEPFKAWIVRRKLRAVVIDVLAAFTDERIDSHNDTSVRRMLTGLKEVAEATGCLLIVVRHLTKGKGVRAIYAGQGSIAYGGAARAVLVAATHPREPDAFVLAVVKSNLAPKEWRSTLAYRPRSVRFDFDDGTVGTAAKIDWGEVVDLSADDLSALPGDDEERSARADAAEWLGDYLDAGPQPAAEVERAARAAGHAWATVRRAKSTLGVTSRKVGSEWKWLKEDAHPAQGVVPEQDEHLGEHVGPLDPETEVF